MCCVCVYTTCPCFTCLLWVWNTTTIQCSKWPRPWSPVRALTHECHIQNIIIWFGLTVFMNYMWILLLCFCVRHVHASQNTIGSGRTFWNRESKCIRHTATGHRIKWIHTHFDPQCVCVHAHLILVQTPWLQNKTNLTFKCFPNGKNKYKYKMCWLQEHSSHDRCLSSISFQSHRRWTRAELIYARGWAKFKRKLFPNQTHYWIVFGFFFSFRMLRVIWIRLNWPRRFCSEDIFSVWIGLSWHSTLILNMSNALVKLTKRSIELECSQLNVNVSFFVSVWDAQN